MPNGGAQKWSAVDVRPHSPTSRPINYTNYYCPTVRLVARFRTADGHRHLRAKGASEGDHVGRQGIAPPSRMQAAIVSWRAMSLEEVNFSACEEVSQYGFFTVTASGSTAYPQSSCLKGQVGGRTGGVRPETDSSGRMPKIVEAKGAAATCSESSENLLRN